MQVPEELKFTKLVMEQDHISLNQPSSRHPVLLKFSRYHHLL
jgi:hypothetical protein